MMTYLHSCDRLYPLLDPSVEVTHVMVIRSSSSGLAVVVLHCYCSYDGYALVGSAASLCCRCDGEAQPRLQPLPMSSSDQDLMLLGWLLL
ncbi:hypothetical protein VPH35_027395 [Triticum aestivum]